MKHLTTLLALLLSFSMLGQNFPVPYNPDGDANGLIGTPDLLSLLALFGEEFSAAVVAENNESAILYVGELEYPLCAQSCRNLPGMWELPTIEDLGLVWDEVHPSNVAASTWLKPNQLTNTTTVRDVMEFVYSDSEWSGSAKFGQTETISTEMRCYCTIKEIPKVEYDYCIGYHSTSGTNESEPTTSMQEVKTCVDEKLLAGWQLLGPVVLNGMTGSHTQTLWRWAE